MATRFERAPFEIVDDSFALRIRNTDPGEVYDLMVQLDGPSRTSEGYVHVLHPGDAFTLVCPQRFFGACPSRLALTWREDSGDPLSIIVTM